MQPAGLDRAALVAGEYDTRSFRLTPRARFMFAGGRGMHVRRDTAERRVLPNGAVVKVEVDASGHATHIHEDHRLHAVARPDTFRMALRSTGQRPDDGALRALFRRLAARRS